MRFEKGGDLMPAVLNGRACIFGAGGPVGAAAAKALKDHYALRLTDARPIEEVAREGRPQSPRAPLPEVLGPPHERRVVDVTDYAQALDAARGMDALINVTVVRAHPAQAFRVNAIGAYNVAKAAVACGVRRVIHTGPLYAQPGHEADYWYDFDIPEEAPIHPGTELYMITKGLGEQVMRVFAERAGLEVIAFRFSSFRPGDGGDAEEGSGVRCCTASWEDTGAAFLHALRAPDMPGRYEAFHICAALPHGKYSPAKAERLLGWRAKDRFERLYRRTRP